MCTCYTIRSKRSIKHKLKFSFHETIPREQKKLIIDKGLEDRGTGQFRRRQDNSDNFIHNKDKRVRRCEDIKHEFFDLVPQGQTKLYANSLKEIYYTYGIKFQNNGINVQYAVNNLLIPTMSVPIEPALKADKTALSMV